MCIADKVWVEVAEAWWILLSDQEMVLINNLKKIEKLLITINNFNYLFEMLLKDRFI